ncbi:hypothetical protein CR513_48791, partial [Mucuna pruriens]
MWQKQPNNSSFNDSVKALEDDIQHANTMAAALPRDYDGNYFQMKLSYSPFAPLFLYLIEWLDFSCTHTLPMYLGLLHILIFNVCHYYFWLISSLLCFPPCSVFQFFHSFVYFATPFYCGNANELVVYADGMPSISSKERKATIKEFYGILLAVLFSSTLNQLCRWHAFAAIIYPSLRLLQGEFNNDQRSSCAEAVIRKRIEKVLNKDLEGDEECGICMENSMKMVLPNCGHSLYMRSESCPFCRGSLRRISPRDLWVVIGNSDVVDRITIAKENLRRLYLYVETLPPIISDTHIYTFNYML